MFEIKDDLVLYIFVIIFIPLYIKFFFLIVKWFFGKTRLNKLFKKEILVGGE